MKLSAGSAPGLGGVLTVAGGWDPSHGAWPAEAQGRAGPCDREQVAQASHALDRPALALVIPFAATGSALRFPGRPQPLPSLASMRMGGSLKEGFTGPCRQAVHGSLLRSSLARTSFFGHAGSARRLARAPEIAPPRKSLRRPRALQRPPPPGRIRSKAGWRARSARTGRESGRLSAGGFPLAARSWKGAFLGIPPSGKSRGPGGGELHRQWGERRCEIARRWAA